jgi:hypothetical protein
MAPRPLLQSRVGKGHPKVQHRLAEIHLAKIGKLDRGEQLIGELPTIQTDDQAA